MCSKVPVTSASLESLLHMNILPTAKDLLDRTWGSKGLEWKQEVFRDFGKLGEGAEGCLHTHYYPSP